MGPRTAAVGVVTDGPDLRTWEQPDGALRLFEQYWLPTTDAPREYIIATSFGVLAATVENRVWLPFGGERIYPNLWILILGPSSFFRKSTCIAKGRRTLARLYDGDNGHGPLLPDEFSREALLKRLSDRGQGLLTYSEFSGALATFRRDYMAGTPELLADLYDSPASYTRLVGAQTWTLSNVCLSILAASQTDWFLEKLKAGDVRGGFLARFSFWPAFHKKRFLAVPPEPDARIGNDLIRALNAIRQVRGAVTFTPTLRDQYGSWLERHERELHGTSRAGELSAFWSRLSVMTLKFATLMQIAHDQTTVLKDDTLKRAIGLTEYLKAALRQLFEEEFAFSKDMQDRQRVLRMVRQRSGLSFRDLLRASSLLKRQLEPVLETLAAEGYIRREKDGSVHAVSEVSVPVSDAGADRVPPRFSRVK